MNQDHERDRTVVGGGFAGADAAQQALAALRADGYTDEQLGWLFQSRGTATAGGLLTRTPDTSLHDTLLSLDLSSVEAGELDTQARGGQSVVLVRAGARYLEAGSVLERFGAHQHEDVRAAAYAANPASAALNESVQVAGARASDRITPSTATDGTPEPVTYRRAGSIDERGAADVAVTSPTGGAASPDQNPTSPGTSDLVPNPAPASTASGHASLPAETVTSGATTTASSAPIAAGDNLTRTAPMPTSAAQPMMAEMQAQRTVEDASPREPAQRPLDDSHDVAEGTKQTHVGTISNTETGA